MRPPACIEARSWALCIKLACYPPPPLFVHVCMRCVLAHALKIVVSYAYLLRAVRGGLGSFLACVMARHHAKCRVCLFVALSYHVVLALACLMRRRTSLSCSGGTAVGCSGIVWPACLSIVGEIARARQVVHKVFDRVETPTYDFYFSAVKYFWIFGLLWSTGDFQKNVGVVGRFLKASANQRPTMTMIN